VSTRTSCNFLLSRPSMACPGCHTSLYGSNPLIEAILIIFQVRKEMLLDSEALRQFQNHSSQMAALDFIVSTASDVFLPTYDGNMAKLVEGHRRYATPTGEALAATAAAGPFPSCTNNVSSSAAAAQFFGERVEASAEGSLPAVDAPMLLRPGAPSLLGPSGHMRARRSSLWRQCCCSSWSRGNEVLYISK
jgi:hypothetical protein